MTSLRRLVGKSFLRANRWKVEGHFPGVRRAVLVSAPHTSNWDFVYMMAICMAEGVFISFVAKHTLFVGPLGVLLRFMGGIPIRRDVRSNTVSQLVDVFESRQDLILAVPPEGTRGYVEYWKSGFYHTARGADVPVVLGFLDYQRRRGGYGPCFHLSGDVSADMDRLRDFYSGIVGRRPECFGRIRLRDEDDEEARENDADAPR